MQNRLQRVQSAQANQVKRQPLDMNATRWSTHAACYVLMAVVAGTADAQCGGGINTGGGNCTPPTAPGMPGYDSSGVNNNQPQPSYVSQWGAIALDDDVDAAGTVTGRSSEREAKRDALADCAAKGGRSCHISLVYDNECAAAAWETNLIFLASERTIEEAKDRAMAKCQEKRSSCQIVYSACSLPRRVN